MKNDIEWIDILKAIGHKEEWIERPQSARNGQTLDWETSEWNELRNAWKRPARTSPYDLKDLTVQWTTKRWRARSEISGLRVQRPQNAKNGQIPKSELRDLRLASSETANSKTSECKEQPNP